MSKKEQDLLQKLWDACSVLPKEKQEFLIGYAEGVIAGTQPAATPQLPEPAPSA